MKKCPQCGGEYDASMSFCLDDGADLLYGPATSEDKTRTFGADSDEPQTAILSVPPAAASGSGASEAQTWPQISLTDQTEILPNSVDRPIPVQASRKNSLIAGVLGIILVSALGIGSYWYYGRSSAKQIESIAVMPFVNESKNEEVEYLSDGMTETLISSLSNLPNLNVKPRSSVFRYKGKETNPQTIAKELNVQAILNGRVVQRGNEIVLYIELIDAQKDTLLWKGDYNRQMSNLVSLQSEIAKDVSTELKAKLSGADETKVTKTSTVNPEAYQAYLKGRYYINRRTTEDIKKAIEQFKAATDRDPNYALAFAGLADCYALLSGFAGTPLSETLPQARAFAERALAIDNQLGEPHSTLGFINEQLRQWAEAEREYKRAIELSPNYATAYVRYAAFLRTFRRFDESDLMIKKAQELDPLSSAIFINVSINYQIRNDHNASIENTLKLIELDPNYATAYSYLGLSYLKLKRNAEAIESLEKAVKLSNRDSIALSLLGYGNAVTEKRPEAIAIAKELEGRYAEKKSSGFYIAVVYAGLDDKDKAFEWLEKDFQNNEDLRNIGWAFPLESRDDPRFKDLLKRMGLPE